MNFIKKFKETAIAIIPLSLLVYLVSFFIAPLPSSMLISFGISTVLVIVGLTLFITGADLGLVPSGAFLGAAITKTRKLPLILVSGIIIGFVITIAEPSLIILALQVEDVALIPAQSLVRAVALGVGLFLALALGRTIFQIPMRFILLIGYALVFFFASKISPAFTAIAFDAGGATTGPMTVPFIIALGVGVSNVRGEDSAIEDSFGFTGIASIGPILAVAIFGFFSSTEKLPLEAALPLSQQSPQYWLAFVRSTKSVLSALGPLLAIIIFFQIVLLKIPRRQWTRIIIGFIYAALGLILFFVGTETAFMPVAFTLGEQIAATGGGALILLSILVGGIVACAEPAIWILTEQVEEVSGGNIRRPVMLAALAIGLACATGLSMWRVLAGFSIWYFLIPIYALALGLTFITPKLYTAIAFDSGGVASGPMSSTFILSLTIGASTGINGNPGQDAFGLVAMIAATPLVIIQILGFLFSRKEQKIFKRSKIS